MSALAKLKQSQRVQRFSNPFQTPEQPVSIADTLRQRALLLQTEQEQNSSTKRYRKMSQSSIAYEPQLQTTYRMLRVNKPIMTASALAQIQLENELLQKLAPVLENEQFKHYFKYSPLCNTTSVSQLDPVEYQFEEEIQTTSRLQEEDQTDVERLFPFPPDQEQFPDCYVQQTYLEFCDAIKREHELNLRKVNRELSLSDYLLQFEHESDENVFNLQQLKLEQEETPNEHIPSIDALIEFESEMRALTKHIATFDQFITLQSLADQHKQCLNVPILDESGHIKLRKIQLINSCNEFSRTLWSINCELLKRGMDKTELIHEFVEWEDRYKVQINGSQDLDELFDLAEKIQERRTNEQDELKFVKE
ncbi:Hypothetical_protein [Hexamita inflata]|uniref:Hypothetical_protein n=1 Tax=Hexamita inflata TaxID=28002 RepID=A0AA86V9R3_9EUKA|nr:Hypothetical protein HINF_LOCUS48063 [Hexamita inflata]